MCRGTGLGLPPAVCLTCDGHGHISAGNPFLRFREAAWTNELLAASIQQTGSDFGNLQLFDAETNTLRIAAQQGFGPEFLLYFREVSGSTSACGAAMEQRSRIVSRNVALDPVFHNGSKDMLLRSGVRSVQSTPLITPSGIFIGMLSTHFDKPRAFPPRLLKELDAIIASFMANIEADANSATNAARTLD